MRVDVAILGGGLAGLTLSLQLRQRFPDLAVAVLERRSHPVPEATHKVGESSVEIAAHYFEDVLGLGEHLARCQLKKFGFRFFFSEKRGDLDSVLELGASTHLATPSYQIDRGIFENFLGERSRQSDVEFLDGLIVRGVDLADGEEDGFVKILTRKGSGEILGATIVARHAGEMISEITLALVAKVGLGSLAGVIHPYPTQAEAIRQIGDLYNRTRLTPTVKRLFQARQ